MKSEFERTQFGAPATAQRSIANNSIETEIIEKIIETEIIPGLKTIYGKTTPDKITARSSDLADEKIEHFLQLKISQEPQECRDYVDQLRRSGMSNRQLFGDVFGNTARRLGQLWEDDRLSFVDVTIGLSRLHGLLRDYSEVTELWKAAGSQHKSIHLMPAPGEQHIFGMLILAEHFRSQGWRVETEFSIRDAAEAQSCAESRQCSCIGFTISNERCIATLTDSVSRLRNTDKWSTGPILVGGTVVERDTALIDVVGADGSANNEIDAVSTADCLLKNANLRQASPENRRIGT
ncbi:MAG: hypothetical protein AAGB04_05510 [Pseudomonadota bacterium]